MSTPPSDIFRVVLMRASVGMRGLLLFLAVTISLFLLQILLLIHVYLPQLHPECRSLQNILISMPRKKKIDPLLLMLIKKGRVMELSRIFLCFILELHVFGTLSWTSSTLIYFDYDMYFTLDYGMNMCFVMDYDIYDIIFIGEICISSCCRF